MNNLITIYSICYNEEVMLPHFIEWYRTRFPDCRIVLYDNMSTDNTRQIAVDNNCEIIDYDSNNEIRDDLYLEIKNNCWKTATTPFVFVGDIDELVDINEDHLRYEQKLGSTMIKFEGWNMINTEPNPKLEINQIIFGSRAFQYDKNYIYNKDYISEINFSAGCHSSSPIGKIKYSETVYKMYHFKSIDVDYMVKRHLEFGKRLSQKNLQHFWGIHYLDSEEVIRHNYIYYQTHPELKQVR